MAIAERRPEVKNRPLNEVLQQKLTRRDIQRVC
jgi:hypothetical protein